MLVDALLAAAEARLDELGLAMQRIEDGAYGRCDGCGRPISEARLEALPTTTSCVACAT